MKLNKNLTYSYSRKEILQVSFLFVFLFFVYTYLTFRAGSDMVIHAGFARKMLEGKMNYPGNFIWYVLVNILSVILSVFPSWLPPLSISIISLTFLMACATTYKFCWVYEHILERGADWKRFMIALSLIFVFAIPIPSIFVTHRWSLGNFPPNIWYNSTIILIFPFVIMLFVGSMKQIEQFSNRRNLWLLLLVFLNIFIKPSYFFVWVCVYPVFLFIKYRITTKFLKGLIPVMVGIVLLLIEYLYIYYLGDSSDKESSIVIRPFLSYYYFAPVSMFPWALLSSLLFPILHFSLNFKRLVKDKTFQFVYTGLLVAFIIGILVVEAGPRQTHGNFFWQIYICAWLCFYISLKDLLKMKKRGSQFVILMMVYLFHVLCGMGYLAKYMIFGQFR